MEWCAFPRCSAEIHLTWLGYPLCQRHWNQICEEQESGVPRAVILARLERTVKRRRAG